ncbi:MAG: iron ABC transporter permease [Cytophagales bacterium]|nr:MAG: iron ABC transporter permease [Cytophagales bacterium]
MKKHAGLYLLLCLLMFAGVFSSLQAGSTTINIEEIITFLFTPDSTQDNSNILWKIRLPKTLTAIIVGAGLSVSGLLMQTLFRNPLASPSILGVSSGASVGVAFVVLGFSQKWTLIGHWSVVGAAITGACLYLLLIMSIATQLRNAMGLLIVGMMLGSATSAVVGIWQYFSEPSQLQSYLIWTFGSLSLSSLEQWYILMGVVTFCLVISFFLAKTLNALLLGEEYAQSIGVSMQRARLIIILLTGIITGAITAFCGPIAFVGIAVPHLARLITQTTQHQVLTTTCVLTGASLLLFCDALTHSFHTQYTLPINAITSLMGAPMVIWIVLRKKALGQVS